MTTTIDLTYSDNAQVSDFTGVPESTPLGEALERSGVTPLQPVPAQLAELPVSALNFRWVQAAQDQAEPAEQTAASGGAVARPDRVTPGDATRFAYHPDIEEAASFLRAGLSVLITCDKLVVPHLSRYIVMRSAKEARLLDVPDQPEGPPAEQEQDSDQAAAFAGLMPQAPAVSLRQRLLTQLRSLLKELNQGHVTVIEHLDLLGGGAEAALANETRDLVDLLYGAEDRVLLAFCDPSIALPEVLAARFAVRMRFEGSPRMAWHAPSGTFAPIERVLVTVAEADRFGGIDVADFYKYVAGLNPVRLRQAITYSYQETEGHSQVTVKDLQDNIRKFKAQASTSFEIPNVTFEQIGGYEDVKADILKALEVMSAARQLPDDDKELRSELIPRGFIFHGEPGTGKTLFAKAIANSMDATIQVVSGPEVTDKYVGESERKIRDLFAEARRNAPAVIVFDEFDSIAANRTTAEDGGSRAGNAMVAQILTEMDGFRPDVQMLVIGTTNRLEIIDRALLRPSRFQSFHIGLPDPSARAGIIEVHSGRFHIDVTGLVAPLVEATEGWNGDEIRALFRDAFVGQWREGKVADAARLGELVGRMQRARREQWRSKAGRG